MISTGGRVQRSRVADAAAAREARPLGAAGAGRWRSCLQDRNNSCVCVGCNVICSSLAGYCRAPPAPAAGRSCLQDHENR